MTKEEIYDLIIEWQIEAGEDFLDYFDSYFRVVSFMCWARGKGYIAIEQFNKWEEDNDSDSDYMSVCVHDCHGHDKGYAVVCEEGWTKKGQEKAYMILAEFFSESATYQKRFKKFLEENEIIYSINKSE
jgi:hypothetical protein